MTRIELDRVQFILDYFIESKEITEYFVNSSKDIIKVRTSYSDKDDIDFLHFKIIMSCACVNEDFEKNLKLEVI